MILLTGIKLTIDVISGLASLVKKLSSQSLLMNLSECYSLDPSLGKLEQ
ncbi:hypothetical protein M8C21_014340, partial [Ambrosia artemisiifolia]